MKVLKKGLVLLLAFVMVLSLAACGEKKEGFNNDVKKSVVFVATEVIYEGKSLGFSVGTAFFVGTPGINPQYLVTNYHVLESYIITGGGEGSSNLMVYYDSDDLEEAYLVDYDEVADVAIMKIAKPTDKRQALSVRETEESMTGETVYAVGFPWIAEEYTNATTRFGMNDITITSGCINRIFTETRSGTTKLQMDVSIRSGNSGGPLVDVAGNAIGITTEGAGEDKQLNYSVSIDEVLPLLKKNNVAYQQANVKNSPAIGTILLIAIPSAIILILIIVIVLVLLNNKKKAAQGQKAGEKAQNVSQQTTAVKRAFISSMSPQHGGKKLILSGQPIMIGRDPSVCALSFQSNTNGVSAKHCQLYYDAASQTFVLTDLNSTYGTFYNGSKLAANVPCRLKAKDSFYLGEVMNTIFVDIEN